MHNVNTTYSIIALLCAMQCTCDDGGERFYISFVRHNSISVLQKPLPHIVYYMLLQCMTQNKKKERDWVIGGICLYKFALAWSLSSTEKHTSECGIFWQGIIIVLLSLRVALHDNCPPWLTFLVQVKISKTLGRIKHCCLIPSDHLWRFASVYRPRSWAFNFPEKK